MTHRVLCIALLFALMPPALASIIEYQVIINTSSVSGAGVMVFGFNPGPVAPTPAPDVTISNFSGALLGAVDPVFTTDNVTGALPGSVNIPAQNFQNEFDQNITFAAYIQFRLSFNFAPDSSASDPDTFYFSLLDPNNSFAPLLTSDPLGTAFSIDIYPDGSLLFNNSSSDTTTLDEVPEPATWLLSATALSMFGFRRFRR